MTHTAAILNLLRRFESPHVTFLDPAGDWPIVWERARDVWVWDADGARYLDLTAAFGVAAAGHANPRVVRAGQQQMARLLHAMGDVHPHPLKAQLARELSRLTFERWAAQRPASPPRGRAPARRPLTGKTIFCNSGFEAVEAALKTALLATNRPGVIAFEGAYHGLGYGALNVTHRDFFRRPFHAQLRAFGHFLPFPTAAPPRRRPALGAAAPDPLRQLEAAANRLFQDHAIGAILVEPIQGRAGIRVPPAGFLPLLRRLCDAHHALLIVDEIYTGFGRTGAWFACEHAGVVPDLICLGKALTGGFPLSACVGRAELMDAAWPASTGEAIHTSTFLGHPVGCAMALAQIAEIRRRRLCARSARLGRWLQDRLQSEISSAQFPVTVRGCGLMLGLEWCRADGTPDPAEALRVLKAMLRRGFILLPEGEAGNVLSLTPPLTISETHLARTVRALAQTVRGQRGGPGNRAAG